MDGTRDSRPKRSKSERERQIPYHVTYMWNLKHGTNEPIDKTETDHGQGKQTCVWGRGVGGSGMDRELGVGRYKLLHLEWLGNRAPTVQHREPCTVSWGRTRWKTVFKKTMYLTIYLYMAGLLCCTTEIY